MLQPDSALTEDEPVRLPWMRVLLVLAVLWASLWASGFAGAEVGRYLYEDKYVPQAPYSDEELATLERMSPETYAIAQNDMKAWDDSVSLGRTIASLEGRVIGSLLALGIWGSLGVVWLWNRQKERRLQLSFAHDFD